MDEPYGPLGKLARLGLYALASLGLLGGMIALFSRSSENSDTAPPQIAEGVHALNWTFPSMKERDNSVLRQITHDEPPDPELLRNAPAAQAYYDAAAEPGDYVTPPSVSVRH